jgi:hypothetical protein
MARVSALMPQLLEPWTRRVLHKGSEERCIKITHLCRARRISAVVDPLAVCPPNALLSRAGCWCWWTDGECGARLRGVRGLHAPEQLWYTVLGSDGSSGSKSNSLGGRVDSCYSPLLQDETLASNDSSVS